MKTANLYLACALLCGALCGCHAPQERDTVYQTSTINALLEGVYDGQETCGALKRRGDLGIGTFNALDGEMVMVGGRIYRVSADGQATEVPDSTRTPFAAVTFFDSERIIDLPKGTDYARMQKRLDSAMPGIALPYAIRMVGRFDYVKTRSVPRQSKPYPRLVEVVKNQPTFEFSNVGGTIVGFRLPGYVKELNVPGYHLHFLTDDRTAGGHVLEFLIGNAPVELDLCDALHVALPRDRAFAEAMISGRSEGELHHVEQ